MKRQCFSDRIFPQHTSYFAKDKIMHCLNLQETSYCIKVIESQWTERANTLCQSFESVGGCTPHSFWHRQHDLPWRAQQQRAVPSMLLVLEVDCVFQILHAEPMEPNANNIHMGAYNRCIRNLKPRESSITASLHEIKS